MAQAPASDDSALAEVVVTAQFREQNLQDTPIAITAVNAEMLESRNQTSLSAVAAQAPNVNLRETGGAFGPGMSAEIRGVGQRDFNPAFEPGVGVYIDDVYYSSLTGANFDLLDLDRVEIARGPQGVLGGRNSEGGSIKLYSQKPKGDDSGSVRATYGTRSLLDIRATGDFALVDDVLSVRVSGVSRKQKGYVGRYDYGCVFPGSGVPTQAQQGDCFLGNLGGKSYSAGRAAFRWQASDAVEANFSVDMTVDDSEAAAIVLQNAASPAEQQAAWVAAGSTPPPPSGSANTTTFGVQYGKPFVPTNRRVSYASFTQVRPNGSTISFAPTTRTKVWGTNLTLDFRLAEALSLKSVTAYREFDSRWTEDNDVSPLSGSLGAEHMLNHSFSQELRLNGTVGVVDYTIGGYYFDQTTTYQTHQILTYAFPGFEFLGNDPVSASSYAGFANLSWHITDALTFDAGVRYTKEEKDYAYSRNPVGTSTTLGLTVLNGTVGAYEGDNVDYRANLNYRWTEQFMTYASISTAFKGGGTNARPFGPAQVVPFNKEELTAYELGVKADFFERRLRVNAAGFVNKFKDIQLTLLRCPSLVPASPCAATFNAGDADIKGLELEVEAHPVDGMTIDASISTLDFEYTRLAPNTGLTLGQQAPGTIDSKWAIGAQYEIGMSSGASLTPRVDVTHTGGFNTNAVFAESNRVDAYEMVNARITWRSPNENWDIAVVASNLFDEEYFVSNFDLLSSSGAQYGILGVPREYSIQVKKKF